LRNYKGRSPLSYYRTALPGVDYSELQGKLIVIEGPDAVGRSTQVRRLKPWLEEFGHAVLDTGMARSALAGKGIKEAKAGNTLGPITMTLYYATDFADRLENEIIPALRAGFVVLTDRYIFSIMARAIARGENRTWIERTAGFALVPHAVLYMRAEVKDLISRVVVGRGAFDYWESGLDLHIGKDMYESFVRYQSSLIQVFDDMADPYGFEVIDASQPVDRVFESLKKAISKVVEMEPQVKAHVRRKVAVPVKKVAAR
jgi:dTMP kinase